MAFQKTTTARTPRWRFGVVAVNLAALKSKQPDPYAVLGLDRKCTAEQIRTAYRLLVKQHHPDVNGGCARSAAHTRELNEAYAILGNTETRRAHDRKQVAAEKSRTRQACLQPDISREISLRFAEMLRGTKLDVRVNDPSGIGEAEVYTLTVPPATAPGTRFRIARDTGGFVHVKVRAQPDFQFKPRGSDLRCDLRIRAQRAAQGGTEPLRGVMGEVLRITIPRGVARGEIIRIEGKGLPKPRGGRGDLLVRIIYAPEVRIRRTR